MAEVNNDEDLRELLASKILDKINVPHANIVLAYNGNEHGCLSINILREDETFVEFDSDGRTECSVRDYIEKDISKISVLPNMTPEVIEERKAYLSRLLYCYAILFNTDTSYVNSQIIYNQKTQQYRNPEIYDLALSFSSYSDRTFFRDTCVDELLKELYENYSAEILPIAREVEEELTPENIDDLLSDPVYDDFAPQVKEQIVSDLKNRINLVKEYNHRMQEHDTIGPSTISIASIAKKTQGVSVILKEKAGALIANLKNRLLGREDISSGNCH